MSRILTPTGWKDIIQKVEIEDKTELDEISQDMQDRYMKKAKKQIDKTRDQVYTSHSKNYASPEQKEKIVKKYEKRIDKRNKGIGSVLKRSSAEHEMGGKQTWTTSSGSQERIDRGEKGSSMTTKTTGQVAKAWQEYRKKHPGTKKSQADFK